MAAKWEEVHARALKRFDAVWLVQHAERKECLDDRRFYSIRGAQWDAQWGDQFENAPRMEVNKTHKEIIRIISDYRNNRINVDFRADDHASDDQTAEALDGLYRADFEDCGQESLDNAFEEGVGGGMGAWRLRTSYEDESDPDNDHQRICFEPLTDADQRVFFDPDAKRQDKADAKWAIVLNPLSPEAFEDEYPDHSPTDFAELPWAFEWFRDAIENVGGVYTVGEYYEVSQIKSKKIVLNHPVIEGEKVLIDPTDEELSDLEAQGWKIDRTRNIKKPEVRKYVVSGVEVLEEETIAGPNIPIIPFYAKRWVVDNIERCAGHTRYAKDPQRIYNGQVSWLSEVASMSPFEKPIFDPEQVAGLEQQWAEGNIRRHPYALARALRNEDGTVVQAGPVGKVEPPSVPPALAALLQIAGQDIAELTGAADQPEQIPANTSAQAIELVHNRVDARNFIYMDNFVKAVRRGGVVWQGMAGELYVEEGRKMQAIDQNDGRDYVEISQPALAKDGSQITINDFSGPYRCLVSVGPSSQSQRDATVRSLVGMAQVAGAAQDAQLAQACITSALAHMDGEGLDDLKKWVRMRGIQMGVIQPTDEEKQELQQQAQQQQPPSAEDQLAAAKAADLGASVGQRKADTALKLAQAQAVGGPAAAPTPPDGLEAVHKASQIRKNLADAANTETQTAHLPQKLAIEATNAQTNRIKAQKGGAQ